MAKYKPKLKFFPEDYNYKNNIKLITKLAIFANHWLCTVWLLRTKNSYENTRANITNNPNLFT